MCDTIRVLGKQTRKATQLQFYKTMAISSLLYGSEGWILRHKDESGIQSAEMKFLRAVKGCTRLDHIRKEKKIRDETEVKPILAIRQYKEKWGEHLQRMKKKVSQEQHGNINQREEETHEGQE
jgi:hypothetical protein